MPLFPFQYPTRRTIFLGVLLVSTGGLVWLALLIPFSTPLSEVPLKVGDVASQDILAPYAHTYQSQILTEQKRIEAGNRVAPVYDPVDTSVGRRQLDHLRATLAYISSARADRYASLEQKLADLAALEDIRLSQETATNILALSEARWQTVQQETTVVLEQIMRATIRSDQLEEARRSVPALVSLTLPDVQAQIVSELASAFVVFNSPYNDAATETARQQARDGVPPVEVSFQPGESIVSHGRVITSIEVEALQEYGLIGSSSRWEDLGGAAILALLVVSFLVLYISRNVSLYRDLRKLTVIAILFLVFLYSARLTIPGHTILPYLYPLMAYSLLVAVLFGAESALITVLPLAILVSNGMPNSLDLTLFYVLSSFFGVLTLRRAQRIMSFLWAGLAIAVSGAAVVIAYRLPLPTSDWVGLATLAGAAVINGLASASISVLLQLFLAQLLGMTTALQLIELSRPDHSLLQYILRNAPGTYQHSLQVANLAEQAAERIGADTLLTRVGALYHDAGKACNPEFFIENQMVGNLNPHHDLDPTISAAAIIRHVTDGVDIARRHRLPKRIQAFITEHHGTLITQYQYARALEAVGRR